MDYTTKENWEYPTRKIEVEYYDDHYPGESNIIVEDDDYLPEYKPEMDKENNLPVEKATRPDHYKTPAGIELFEITDYLNFNLGNVVKYVFRAGKKSDNVLEDLKKALVYLQREIDRLS